MAKKTKIKSRKMTVVGDEQCKGKETLAGKKRS